jgi:Fungal Zn(2)-Cys(6) binuclear cluster domain
MAEKGTAARTRATIKEGVAGAKQPVACMACRKVHVRCDMGNPCGRCARRGALCVPYGRKSDRRKQKRSREPVSLQSPTTRPDQFPPIASTWGGQPLLLDARAPSTPADQGPLASPDQLFSSSRRDQPLSQETHAPTTPADQPLTSPDQIFAASWLSDGLIANDTTITRLAALEFVELEYRYTLLEQAIGRIRVEMQEVAMCMLLLRERSTSRLGGPHQPPVSTMQLPSQTVEGASLPQNSEELPLPQGSDTLLLSFDGF